MATALRGEINSLFQSFLWKPLHLQGRVAICKVLFVALLVPWMNIVKESKQQCKKCSCHVNLR